MEEVGPARRQPYGEVAEQLHEGDDHDQYGELFVRTRIRNTTVTAATAALALGLTAARRVHLLRTAPGETAKEPPHHL